MRIRTALFTVALLVAGPAALAQFSKSTMQGQVSTSFPDNTTGQITPATTRTFLNNLVNSFQQYTGVNPQAGATYNIQSSDYGQLVRFSAGTVNVSLSPANATGFTTFNFYATHITSGNVVITPTSGQICGASSLTLANTQSAWIISDGTNWQCQFSVNAQLTTPVSVANGGTGGSVASGALLDNITGFSSNGILARTASNTYQFLSFAGGITPGNITLSNLTTLCNPTNTNATPVACSPGQMSAVLCTPTMLNFVTGANTTYNTPTCNGVRASYLEIEMVGAGGGGGGSGSAAGTVATAGTATCWNTSGTACSSPLFQAGGGGAGSVALVTTNSSGGTASNCDVGLSGANGKGSSAATLNNAPGADGAVSYFGGAGVGGLVNGIIAGSAATANTGSGGGGGGGVAATPVATGSAGAAGAYCRKLLLSPAASYVFTIGTKGNGGGAGTSGAAGGAGADGILNVKARWQ